MSGRAWRKFERRRILVNLVDGSVFAGILWDGRGPLVLRDVEALADTNGIALASPAKLDGEVIIDFARVAWVQSTPPRTT